MCLAAICCRMAAPVGCGGEGSGAGGFAYRESKAGGWLICACKRGMGGEEGGCLGLMDKSG